MNLAPLVLLALAILSLAFPVFALYARLFRLQCGEDELLIMSGWFYRTPGGASAPYRVIPPGYAAWRVPLMESYRTLPLQPQTVRFEVARIPARGGIPISATASARCRPSKRAELLAVAVEWIFAQGAAAWEAELGAALARQLEIVIRDTIPEELDGDQEWAADEIRARAWPSLEFLGARCEGVTFERIWDDVGYLDRSGEQQIATVLSMEPLFRSNRNPSLMLSVQPELPTAAVPLTAEPTTGGLIGAGAWIGSLGFAAYGLIGGVGVALVPAAAMATLGVIFVRRGL